MKATISKDRTNCFNCAMELDTTKNSFTVNNWGEIFCSDKCKLDYEAQLQEALQLRNTSLRDK